MTNKGHRYERSLVRALEAAGYAVLPAGSSGSGNFRGGRGGDRPDMLAGRNRGAQVWCIEVKMTSKTTAYADADEVEQLTRFATAMGATPVIAARFSGERIFWLVRPDDCRMTPEGNYGIPEADRRERALHKIHEVD